MQELYMIEVHQRALLQKCAKHTYRDTLRMYTCTHACRFPRPPFINCDYLTTSSWLEPYPSAIWPE